MKITCKCFNFIVEVESFLDLEILQLDLTPLEKFHPYFQKDVYRMTGKINRKTETYSNLIKSEIVGSWNICQCLICRMYIHATNYVSGISTCSSVLQEATDMKLVGRDETVSFSQVFHICFPSQLDAPEDEDAFVPGSEMLDPKELIRIEKQAKSFLEMAENKLKNSTGSLTEQKQQGLEALRRRVLSEKNYLIQMFINSKEEILNDLSVSKGTRKSLLERRYSEGVNMSATHRPALKTKLKSQVLEDDFRSLKINPSRSGNACSEHQPDPETEDIFEMDDFDQYDLGSRVPPHPLDLDENSDGDEASGLSFHREYDAPAKEIARSAPLNVPSWPLSLSRKTLQEDEKRPSGPQEIAESIKEMAKNMRISSVDVFGDLPRPQLPKDSTRYHVP